ncbi:MAG: methylated-DNA--protein-cysteine methyltransferase [Dehalococcoidia bacterium]|nr:MAG: methylated-DNA--protein-cysteine methyltransferase [Dehalococcoidia bacterium]
MQIARFASPLGPLVALTSDSALIALAFDDGSPLLARLLGRRFDSERTVEAVDPLEVASRLRAYFAGELTAIDALPVEGGGTPFQRAVWQQLRTVPPGTTTTYRSLAARLGAPAATRAVGLATAKNPIAIVVPCHRVIGADGSLTGYAGGLARKRWLLAHEGMAVQGRLLGD